MFSQSSANITAALILILLAVLQVKVDCKPAEQTVVKQTCSSTCSPSGYCYYSWSKNGQYVGCSYRALVWFISTSSSDQDTYYCWVRNSALPQKKCELEWGVIYTAEHVCAVKGSSVDLSCSYIYPEGLTVTKSFWFIESLRKTNVEPEDVRESDQYKGRVQYSRTLNYCRMTITDLRESDAHTYRFRFYTDDPKGRYTGSPGVTLSVTDLKVTVSDTDGGVKKLTCSSTCTLPNPTYIWYKNRQPVLNQNRNELNLRDRTVDAGSYSCAVKGYEELRSPAVCVFDKVLQVKVEGPAATVSEGQRVALTCISTCTLPNPTYIWYKNRQPVSQCESASCSVAVVSEAVSYSCAVKSSDLHSPPVYSPKNTRVVILPSGQRVEGDSVTLTCSSDANPPVLSYYWFNQSSDVELGTGQSYSITSISSQHSGLYYCTAHNQLGQSRSGPSRLDVLYSPRPPSVSEIEFDGSVRLVCVSDSNPASSYTWFRKIGGDISQFGEGDNLTLVAGTDGVFYCMAENRLGSSNSSEWTFTSDNRTSVYAASGVAVVLLLIFIAVFLWMRRRAAVTSREREESSGEGASAPVYDEVSTLAVTSDPSRAASSDDQDDVQYSTVHFSLSQAKDVPLYSAVQQSNSLPEEEEVQYAAVNTAKPRTARNDETLIYSTVPKNVRR
ncbi:B-cell receptor CD22-like [Colossoma macropomum]|uniref:B-cell receptor CD22-like n=1 Tax=Colossoma macropomum TaxID=42526 RepID=UPI0018656342|nr:B-cell receptor CD22-like [Colossoma macropomum]